MVLRIMWKQRILASKFPFVLNSEEDAEALLLNDSPERLILLKWIYYLISGCSKDVSVKDLVKYFISVGIVEGDPLKFVEGSMLKKHQIKIWKNLFQFACANAKVCPPEMCNQFADKHRDDMPESYCVNNGKSDSEAIEKEVPLSAVLGTQDLDRILADLQEHLSKPNMVSLAEENKNVLNKLEDFANQCRPNLQPKTIDAETIERQKEFGEVIANLCSTLQSLEAVLKASGTVANLTKHLEKGLDEYNMNSEELLKLWDR